MKFTKEDYVVINYEGELFPAKILDISKNEITIICMQKSKKCWKWPNKEDRVENYPLNEMVRLIREPSLVNKRGIYRIPELEYLWEC